MSFTIGLSSCTGNNDSARIDTVRYNNSTNGPNLMTGTTVTTKNVTDLRNSLIAQINAASSPYVESVEAVGTNGIKITAPLGQGNLTGRLYFTQTTNSCTVNYTHTSSGNIRFLGYVAYDPGTPDTPAVPPSYPGSFRRVDIVSGQTYPKAATRSDCSGSACSYAQEMTNFANWWAYYHTRMQMMKSSAALAFNPIGDKYRVGFAEINIKSRNKNIATFDTATKAAWYTSLRDSVPDGSTPLQTALARAGRIYAGANLGSGGADPVQYSCQQNFSILSSDGYWNGDVEDAVQIDGSTPVGQQDGDLDRPYFDGNSSSNNLADLAAYYYNTDLRTSNCVKDGINVCTNNVPTGGLDTASHQHMTTFTVGLGIPGLMQYQTDYETATNGDYFNIKTGQPSNASGGICSWLTSGTCAWPNPTSITEARIDDLWHAAVNGRGKYYSARDPAALREGLSDALTGVTVRTGSAAAATSSNPNVVAGDNFIFSSTFETVKWTGELKRQSINVSTGQLNAGVDWSARDQLDNQTTRTIYSFDAGAGASKLEPFLWANLSATQQAWFTTPHINALTQFCSTGLTCLNSASQTAAAGENLVKFIAGDRTNEGDAFDVSKFYRQRDNLLGDIVNAEPVYVKKPLYNYTDSGYAGFVSAQSGRAGTVYAAANDGMLHAFNADDGSERWAFIPTAVMPNLYRLADKDYSKNHRYFVDGTPAVGDAYINGAWSTILVGGLNAGGRSYYALDVTNPSSPKALWEFSVSGGTVNEPNLGLTFGKPEIAKLKDGTWVVMVTSGYNNSSATGSPVAGNGVGYLYVLNAATGEKIREFSTGTGSAANPSGLAPIRAWVDNTDVNNTAARVYGGDLTGRLYRFDVNGDVGAAGYDTHVLATLGRPITSRPQLGEVSGNAMVFIGTGQFLGGTDLSSSGTNSFYAIKDKLDAV
ncbi:MAG TPA: PilC/PilY family type IV pilus protein, partial [Solimonas sp.]